MIIEIETLSIEGGYSKQGSTHLIDEGCIDRGGDQYACPIDKAI